MAKIIMVGSDRKLIDMTSRILQRSGYDVRGAIGIKDAQTSMTGFPSEVIIIERELPDGDGFAFCRELKRQGTHVKILLLSECAADEIPALHSGADDWIKKPYNIDVFLARIETLFRKSGKV